jgi:hypothetical protein
LPILYGSTFFSTGSIAASAEREPSPHSTVFAIGLSAACICFSSHLRPARKAVSDLASCIGTHALVAEARSTLRQRLGQHRGLTSGGGNHRGSIFRLLVGQALLARGDLPPCNSWGVKGDAATASAALGVDREALAAVEAPVEQAVSRYIAVMPFLWLDINDEPGPNSLRGAIEHNAIALLSNCGRAPLDPPSLVWLGHFSGRPLIRGSGLWIQRHVEETHDPVWEFDPRMKLNTG